MATMHSSLNRSNWYACSSNLLSLTSFAGMHPSVRGTVFPGAVSNAVCAESIWGLVVKTEPVNVPAKLCGTNCAIWRSLKRGARRRQIAFQASKFRNGICFSWLTSLVRGSRAFYNPSNTAQKAVVLLSFHPGTQPHHADRLSFLRASLGY